MLSVLATLCLGGHTDLCSSNVQTPLTPRRSEKAQPVVQTQPFLIAGPYDLNPGLSKPVIQPEGLKQQPESTQQQSQVRPSIPAIVPASRPEEGPEGETIIAPEADPTAQESAATHKDSRSQPRSLPVPTHSSLLIISPAARLSGPTPHRTQPLATHNSSPPIQRPGVSQGGAATPDEGIPIYSPAVRPSGPSPPLRLVPKTPKSSNLNSSSAIVSAPSEQHSAPVIKPADPDIPRFRSLPTPTHRQNISPASQPMLVKNSPPPTLPNSIPIQQPKFKPSQSLPTDTLPIGAAKDPQASFIVLESLTTDFRLDFDEFGKENLELEEIAAFRVQNGDLVTFTTGLNTYKQTDREPVNNIPLLLGWESERGDISLNVAAGAEVFNRLAPQPTFKVGAKTSLFGEVFVSGEVEHGPYKFNTSTLENEISYWRIRPSVFWQIDSKTTFFGLFQAGFFNDGNQEIQSFSRLERKIGPVSIAANVFTWNFAADLEAESGYFSPLSFLVYNAEVGWKGKIFDPLTCQFAASIGSQIVNGDKSTGRGLQAKCTASLADNVDLDFGYVLTNIISSGSGASNSHIFTGQFRINF